MRRNRGAMQTLVICIDRDNDLGEKAKRTTPIVGREANIEAATTLGIADPEDSDTNTIFGGIRVLDELRAKGIDAEIVSFAGDRNVGVISDQKIAEQLESFLDTHEVKGAVFVSDGAEDETLVPIVQSRIKIDSVKRIVVMQSENLESTYYILKHAFSDPKISQTFFVPVGLAFLIYAIFLLARYPEGAVVGILAAVGMYMLYRGFGLDDTLALQKERLGEAFKHQRLIFVSYTAALLTGVVATAHGAAEVWGLYSESGIWYHGTLTLISVFINAAVWWYAGAFLLADFGKMFDLKMAGKSTQKTISVSLFIIATGLLFWGASTYLLTEASLATGFPEDSSRALQYFVYSVIVAILIALAGIKVSLGNPDSGEEKKSRGRGKKRKETA
jgi:putative membrane protein